jgi:hypothetical protein
LLPHLRLKLFYLSNPAEEPVIIALWVIGWVLWCMVAGAALLSWALLTSKAAIGEKVILVDASQALFFTLLAVWFYLLPEWNKLHLLWLAPLLSGLPVFFAITRDVVRR